MSDQYFQRLYLLLVLSEVMPPLVSSRDWVQDDGYVALFRPLDPGLDQVSRIESVEDDGRESVAMGVHDLGEKKFEEFGESGAFHVLPQFEIGSEGNEFHHPRGWFLVGVFLLVSPPLDYPHKVLVLYSVLLDEVGVKAIGSRIERVVVEIITAIEVHGKLDPLDKVDIEMHTSIHKLDRRVELILFHINPFTIKQPGCLSDHRIYLGPISDTLHRDHNIHIKIS